MAETVRNLAGYGCMSENDARFEETLEVVLKGLQCEFLSHNGKFYNFKDLWLYEGSGRESTIGASLAEVEGWQ